MHRLFLIGLLFIMTTVVSATRIDDGFFLEMEHKDIPQIMESPESPNPSDIAVFSVNQVGYFVGAPKLAMIAGVPQPVDWSLENVETGESVADGRTEGGRHDVASGYTVQVIDFTEFDEPGTYRLLADSTYSVPFTIAPSLYTTLQRDAFAYFYLNRSGIEIEAQYAGDDHARQAGHLSDDDVTCYAGTDADGRTWEGCDYRLDASKGWYDAGDYGKYVVNSGISVWTLLNIYELFPDAFADGDFNIPESGNGTPDILDEVRWNLEFMLGMQVPEGEPLAGMAHHKLHELQWSGLPHLPPTRVNNDNPAEGRYLMPPTTAATLNLAATAAQCARIYAPFDAAFAERCLIAAERAWSAAMENPSMLAGNTPGAGGGNYDDNRVTDEFFWAAAELFITTGESVYHDYLRGSTHFNRFEGLDRTMSWADTATLGTLSLLLVPNDLDEADLDRLRQQLTQAADNQLARMAEEGYRVSLSRWLYVWGSNSLVLNNAIVMSYAYHVTGDERYLHGVISAMDYVLGRNATGRSFVSGYGEISMENPHHRFWGNEPQNGFPPPPPGAIAGGPNGTPADPAIQAVAGLLVYPARMYVDDRDSYSTNEVTINWNAPLAWVVTFLNQQFD